MSDAEIVVVGICLIAGYGLVSAFYKGREGRGQQKNASDDGQENGPQASTGNQRAQDGPKNQQSSDNDSAERNSRAQSRATPREWYLVLLIQPSASVEEIKTAYRRRMAEYHPDKVAKLGVELRSLAEEKSKEINAAFERAMKARGP